MSTWNLQTNFSAKELECRCGCGKRPTDEAVIALQRLRELCGFPLVITSAARCEKHNKASGGAKGSKHLDSIAFDIACDNSNQRATILRHAQNIGFHGIGIANTFIHLDLRGEEQEAVWLY